MTVSQVLEVVVWRVVAGVQYLFVHDDLGWREGLLSLEEVVDLCDNEESPVIDEMMAALKFLHGMY